MEIESNLLLLFCSLKATAGGGGRGMRLAKEPDEFVKLLQVPLFVELYLLNIIYHL